MRWWIVYSLAASACAERAKTKAKAENMVKAASAPCPKEAREYDADRAFAIGRPRPHSGLNIRLASFRSLQPERLVAPHDCKLKRLRHGHVYLRNIYGDLSHCHTGR
jgi:hypothetical protein